ncbi:MAG: InlB B-repeat-containing protein [Clostridiales Family XIII bacterium]|jgi:uncharacterized repeat protein (TIGR02543 family)|nr:InlB B-repeat-containing protein [Clostridiales Family XIII bacterium]
MMKTRHFFKKRLGLAVLLLTLLFTTIIPTYALDDPGVPPDEDAVQTLTLAPGDLGVLWDGGTDSRTLTFTGLTNPADAWFSVNLAQDETYTLVIAYPDIYTATLDTSTYPEGIVGTPIHDTVSVPRTITYTVSTVGLSAVASAVRVTFALTGVNKVYHGLTGAGTRITATLTETGSGSDTLTKFLTTTVDLSPQTISASFYDPGTNLNNTFQHNGAARPISLNVGATGYPGSIDTATIVVDFNGATIQGSGSPAQSLSSYLTSIYSGLTIDTAFVIEEGDGFDASGTLVWNSGVLTITYPHVSNIPLKITTSALLDPDFRIDFPADAIRVTGVHNGFTGIPAAQVDKTCTISPDLFITLSPFDFYFAPHGGSWLINNFYNYKSSYINRHIDTPQPLLRAYADMFDSSIDDVTIKVDITNGGGGAFEDISDATASVNRLRFRNPAGRIGLYTGNTVKYTDSNGNTADIALTPGAETYWDFPAGVDPLEEGDWFAITFKNLESKPYGKYWLYGDEGSGSSLGPALFEVWGSVRSTSAQDGVIPDGTNGVVSYLYARVYTSFAAGSGTLLPEIWNADETFEYQYNKLPIIVGERVSQNYFVPINQISTLPASGFGATITDVDPGTDIYIKGSASVAWESGATYTVNHDPVILFDLPPTLLPPTDLTAKNGSDYINVTATDYAGTSITPTYVKLLLDSTGKPAKGHNGGYVVAVGFTGTFGTYSGSAPENAMSNNTVYATLKTQVSESASSTIPLSYANSVLATSDWAYAGRGGQNWPLDDTGSVYKTYPRTQYKFFEAGNGASSGNHGISGSGTQDSNYLTTSTWTPNGLSAFGVLGNGQNAITVKTTPAARLDVSVDPYDSNPYDQYIYRSYTAGDPSTVPVMDENRTGNFRIRLYNSFQLSMTGPTEAYFILPQHNNASGSWATTAGGQFEIISDTTPGIEVWYTTGAIDPLAASTSISDTRGLTWTRYISGDALPAGITAMKFYSANGLASGDEYVATFEFTTPNAHGNTAIDDTAAIGRTLYDLGLMGAAPIHSDNGRTAAVALNVNTTQPPATFSVTYHANNGDAVPPTYIGSPGSYNFGATVTVLGNSVTNFTKSGYDFTGWNTATNGSGTAYSAGATFPMPGANVVLYAQWQPSATPPGPPGTPSYTITYHGNGNSAGTAPTATTHSQGTNASIKGQGSLARTGYTFLGWSENAGAVGASFSSGSVISGIARNYDLYAVWRIDTTPPVKPPLPPTVTTPGPIEEGVSEPETPDEQPPDDDEGELTELLGNIPLGDFSRTDCWSLLSMLMSIVGVLIALLLLIAASVRAARRKNEEKDEEDGLYRRENPEDQEARRRKQKTTFATVLTIIAGILVPVLWLILDDPSLPMAWINKWTLYVGILFIIQIILYIVHKVYRKKDGNGTARDES